jgi:hypothetical protein
VFPLDGVAIVLPMCTSETISYEVLSTMNYEFDYVFTDESISATPKNTTLSANGVY